MVKTPLCSSMYNWRSISYVMPWFIQSLWSMWNTYPDRLPAGADKDRTLLPKTCVDFRRIWDDRAMLSHWFFIGNEFQSHDLFRCCYTVVKRNKRVLFASFNFTEFVVTSLLHNSCWLTYKEHWRHRLYLSFVLHASSFSTHDMLVHWRILEESTSLMRDHSKDGMKCLGFKVNFP